MKVALGTALALVKTSFRFEKQACPCPSQAPALFLHTRIAAQVCRAFRARSAYCAKTIVQRCVALLSDLAMPRKSGRATACEAVYPKDNCKSPNRFNSRIGAARPLGRPLASALRAEDAGDRAADRRGLVGGAPGGRQLDPEKIASLGPRDPGAERDMIGVQPRAVTTHSDSARATASHTSTIATAPARLRGLAPCSAIHCSAW